jgi:hypothetical protein
MTKKKIKPMPRPTEGGKWKRDPKTGELVRVGEDGKLPAEKKQETN